jgi:putative transposase
MVNFRRNYLKGGSYFLTLTLRDRRTDYLIKHIDLLRYAMRKTKEEDPYAIISNDGHQTQKPF